MTEYIEIENILCCDTDEMPTQLDAHPVREGFCEERFE